MDPITANRLIERAQKTIERRSKALQETLDDMKLLDELETKTPGAYTYALTAARTKLDRQRKALESAKQFREVITTVTKAIKRA